MRLYKTPAEYRREQEQKQKQQQKQTAITAILNPKYKYIRVKQYAELTGQHPATVYQNLDKGRIEGAIQSGRTWLIPVQKEEANAE